MGLPLAMILQHPDFFLRENTMWLSSNLYSKRCFHAGGQVQISISSEDLRHPQRPSQVSLAFFSLMINPEQEVAHSNLDELISTLACTGGKHTIRRGVWKTQKPFQGINLRACMNTIAISTKKSARTILIRLRKSTEAQTRRRRTS